MFFGIDSFDIFEAQIFQGKLFGRNELLKINYIKLMLTKRGAKDIRVTVKLIDRKYTDNAMAKNEKDKQTNNSTQDITLKNKD